MSDETNFLKYMQKGMFFFIVLLVTVALIGCKPELTDPEPTEITGTFSYVTITTPGGIMASSSPTWVDVVADQTVSYSNNIGSANISTITIDASTSATGAVDPGEQTVSYSISTADITGITIDASTGVVTVSKTATATAEEVAYTVTATGTGNYTGSKTATIGIWIQN